MALELPEIIKIASQLRQILLEKTIVRVEMSESCRRIIEWGFTNLHERNIKDLTIKDVSTKGHYILIKLQSHSNLIFGDLIGKILYHNSRKEAGDKYKILFEISDGSVIAFHTSLYGYAIFLTEEETENHIYFGSKGISPLDEKFTFEYFDLMLKNNEKQPVKKIQSLYDYMQGLQNGYFQDVLYSAGILPGRKICSLSREEKEKLYKNLKVVLSKAVEEGGSIDEVDIFNKGGNYVRLVSSASKGKRCRRCGDTIVQKNILGSNSYFCEGCQV